MAQLRANHPARIAREAEQAKTAFVLEIKSRCLATGADEHRIPAYFAEKINVCEASGRNYIKAPGKIKSLVKRPPPSILFWHTGSITEFPVTVKDSSGTNVKEKE